MAEGRTPPAQVAASDHHHVCKWSICLRWLTEDNTTSTRCKGQGAKDKTESANARTSPTGGCTLKAHSSCPMLSLPCRPRPVSFVTLQPSKAWPSWRPSTILLKSVNSEAPAFLYLPQYILGSSIYYQIQWRLLEPGKYGFVKRTMYLPAVSPEWLGI